MWMMPSSIKVYLAVAPVDFRAGFDRLIGMVRGQMIKDAASGHLFVFRNRRGTQVKVLFFDRTGYVIFHKRLERGVFRLPRSVDSAAPSIELDAMELGLMLEGVDLEPAKKLLRWKKGDTNAPRNPV
jgi:transposase